jgi:hypothetical protein
VPRLHEPLLNEHVGYAGEGLIDFTVIPKPFAQNVKEMVAMRALIRAAETRRRELDPSYDPEQSPLVHIHEHYKEKGAWHVVREQLNSMTRRLGRLESVSVDIQERRTAEDEDRLDAFQGGALEDLGPHVISLGLDVQSSVNTTDRYAIPNRSHTTVERFRYDNSDLPEGVETSFIVRGGTTIIDKERDESHEVSFTWSGGKGLVDKKEAILVFVHPDTSVRSLVIVDLKENKLTVPPEVSDLFPETQFEDNGYGYSVEAGLNGGDPRQSFQSLAEAEIVTKWQHVLARQGASQPPRIHETGLELQELAHAA